MSKQVVIAPFDFTGNMVTSAGEIEFVGGEARKFTKKVGEHLVNNVQGYKYGIIDDPEPEDKEAPADDESKEVESGEKAVALPVLQDTIKGIRLFVTDQKDPKLSAAIKGLKKKQVLLDAIYEYYGVE